MANIQASADHSRTIFDPVVTRARDKLTDEEYVALIQLDRDAITPAIYQQGLKDGAAKALERQAKERRKGLDRRDKQRGVQRIDQVYFIRSADAVKIGTSRNPIYRLGAMQTAHSGKLELAACCPGDAKVEKAYHKRFAAHRLHGEWFEPAPEILAEITRLRTAGEGAGRG